MFGFDKNNNKEKKQVIAYIHTHWDREWYREFEVFRLRLLRVFDNVLNMLLEEKIPSFILMDKCLHFLITLKCVQKMSS